MPAVSNYSEWVIPQVSWVSATTLFLPSTSKGGQLDDLNEPYKLVRIENGKQHIIVEDLPATDKLLCAPDGLKCLVGYSAEKMIDVTSEEMRTWLLFSE